MSYNIFFTSDTHFGHKNIIKFIDYDGNRVRPFDTWEEADEIMVQNWNSVVKPEDKVYFLGDLCFNRNYGDKLMPRLLGKKCLIRGNHDLFKLFRIVLYPGIRLFKLQNISFVAVILITFSLIVLIIII